MVGQTLERWMSALLEYLRNLGTYFKNMNGGDVLEILIIAFLLYYILVWIRNTRAWSLLKGIIVIGVFLMLAAAFRWNTILWIAKSVIQFAVIALIIVMQPELRRALEALGKKKILGSIMSFDALRPKSEGMSEKVINEIVRSAFEMARVYTGALIVIEREDSLEEWERTGIAVDALVSSQLMINIFEKNTPLHDGAVIVSGDRVTSATCYLPLTDNIALDKDLGTRHRAGLGISEGNDCVTVIVSEESGQVSLAVNGLLERRMDNDRLKERLAELLLPEEPETENKMHIGRRRAKK